MTAISDYFMQLLPILAGIAFMLIIRHVAIAKDRIIIRTVDMPKSTRLVEHQMRTDLAYSRGKPRIHEIESARDAAFEREAYDALLVKGLATKNKSGNLLRKLALQKLGMADVSWFSRLANLAAVQNGARLTVLVLNRAELMKHLLTFGGDSGILLQYMAGYALEAELI